MAKEFLDHLLAIREQNLPYAVATVIDVVGSTSAKTGSKALIDQDGNIVTGWVGGGCAESTACHAALDSIASGETAINSFAAFSGRPTVPRERQRLDVAFPDRDQVLL